MNSETRSTRIGEQVAPKLMFYYLSRDRVLSMLDTENVPLNVLLALQGENVPRASWILSNAVGKYVLDAIAAGGVKTLQQLAMENAIQPGTVFVYNGHFYGKGFAYSNKKPGLTLSEKLDEPMEGKKLILEFSKNGLVNDTAYTRMAGSTRLFTFAYITDVTEQSIRAIPYAIGDLVSNQSVFSLPFTLTMELQPEDIDQFSGMERSWMPPMAELPGMADVSERQVKELICQLLGEHQVPSDWGGEESDLFSARLTVDGVRHTGAFLLKGPAIFHPMTPRDLGKNGDQLYRLFNIPAQIYVVQHCHYIGAAVRKTLEAFALHRSFTAPCRFVVMDGLATAQLLRTHGLLAR